MDPALIEAVKQIVTETVTGLKDTLKAEIVAEIKAAGAAMEAAEEVAEAPMPAPVTPMAAAAPATVPVEMVTQMAARVTSAVSGNPALAALIPDIAAAYARGEAEGDAFVKRLGALPRAATTPTGHPAAAFLTQHAAPGPAKPKADPAKLRERAIQIQREHERRTGKPMKYADAIKAAEAQ